MNKNVDDRQLMLFHDTKNSFFSSLQQILYELLSGDMKWEELHEILSNVYQVSDDLSPAEEQPSEKLYMKLKEYADYMYAVGKLQEKEDMAMHVGVFENTGEDTFTSKIKDDYDTVLTAPFLLNIYEKRYLKTLSVDKRFRMIASPELLALMDKTLEAVSPYNWQELMIYRFGKNADELENPIVSENLNKLLDIMQQDDGRGKAICCINNVRDHEDKVQIIYPYRLMYSAFDKKLQLIAVPKEDTRPILMNVAKLSKIRAAEEPNLPQKTFQDLLNKHAVPEPIILKVVDKGSQGENLNGVDRCFMMFSNMKRTAIYNQEQDTFRVELYYYDFEKSDLTNKILQLGPAVTVLQPEWLKEEIIETAKAAYSNYVKANKG